MPERKSSILSIEHASGRLYEVETNSLSKYPLSLYVLASIFMLFFLFVITEPRHTFVFTVGENLRIPTRYSILTQTHYEISIPEGKEGAVDAFSLETCPTFSGQVINLNYEQDLLLNGQDYQYDYFILHPGSIVYAKITVSKGAAYFYLLQGDVFQLESLRHGKSFDVNSFRAVNMVYVSDTNSDSDEGVVVTHTVKNEFAGRGQVWVLYYENPMSSGTTLHTRYAMKATSYNLNSFRPTCSTSSSASSGDHCVVEANPCTIVQASNYYYDDDDDANQDDDGQNKENGNNNNGDGDDDYYYNNQQQQDDAFANADDQYGGNYRGDERYYYNRAKIREVEVMVTLNRNWAVIGGFTGLPTLFGLFIMMTYGRNKKGLSDVENSVNEAERSSDGGYENWENGVKPLPPANNNPPSPSKRDFIKSLYMPNSQWHSPARTRTTSTSLSTMIPPCNPPPPSTEMTTLGSSGPLAPLKEESLCGTISTTEGLSPMGGQEEQKNYTI